MFFSGEITVFRYLLNFIKPVFNYMYDLPVTPYLSSSIYPDMVDDKFIADTVR